MVEDTTPQQALVAWAARDEGRSAWIEQDRGLAWRAVMLESRPGHEQRLVSYRAECELDKRGDVQPPDVFDRLIAGVLNKWRKKYGPPI